MMNVRLKKTLGFALGIIGIAKAASGQLALEWEVSVNKNPAKLPFQYRQFTHLSTSISESNFSQSLIISFTFQNPSAQNQVYEQFYHIDKNGQIVGSDGTFVDYGKRNSSQKWPVFAGEDWLIATGTSAELDFATHENEFRLATGEGDYVTSAVPAELSTSGNNGWAQFFEGKKDLKLFYPSSISRWEQPIGYYRVKENSELVYVQKYLPTLRVTDPQSNSTPQSSISRTDSGVTLSTDTQAGQSYRVQSSQDLKQWSDEEVIQGDGSTKSVQRPADKPREFLRVVEE